MPAPDLYALVGVSADAPVDRLRAAYEQAVGAATRSGDHQRALELSSAFDALPPAIKAQVYRNSRHGAGPVDPWYRTDAYLTERPATRASRRPHRGGRRPGRGPGRTRTGARAVLRNVLLLVAVTAVTALVAYAALFGRTGA